MLPLHIFPLFIYLKKAYCYKMNTQLAFGNPRTKAWKESDYMHKKIIRSGHKKYLNCLYSQIFVINMHIALNGFYFTIQNHNTHLEN